MRRVKPSTPALPAATLSDMSEHEQSSPDPHSARTSASSQRQDTRLESSSKSKRILAWSGAVVIFLLLILPTLGSHGANQRFYEGDHFICFPALGPTTTYPVSMFEETEFAMETAADIGVAATARAKVNRLETEKTFRVALCGEQRSRRVAWALVLTVPTLMIGFLAKSDLIRSRRDGSPQGP